jgi:branched-chain amino acid transport system permease protein
MLYLQLLAAGIQTGALYALTAAGFSLIFGATRTFHAAHGATYALAGYTFVACIGAGWPWPLALAIATVVAVAFGLLLEHFVYRPIQKHRGGFFTVFVASFGVLIIVQSFVEIAFGRGFVAIATPLTRAHQIVPGLYVAPVFWLASGVAVLLFGLLGLFLTRTKAGIGLRALAENPELLRGFGLSSARLSRLAFAIGSALAVPGAVLGAATVGLQPIVGAHVMLISMAATIVGGIGSVRGAAIAGLLLGVVENAVVAVLDTQWSEAASFLVMFAFIVIRPSGLFAVQVAR